MLTLLRKNSIANPEKLLLELIDEQLTFLDQLAREHSTKQVQIPPKFNKVRQTIILVSLIAHLTFIFAPQKWA